VFGGRREKRARLIRCEALDLLAHDAGRVGERHRVLRDEFPLDGVLERDAEHGAEVLTGERRQTGHPLPIDVLEL
jgi:hypothetical protein